MSMSIMIAIPVVHHHHGPLLLLLLFQVSVVEAAGTVFSFRKDNFSNMSDVFLVEEGDWYTGAAPNVSDGAVWLTPDPRSALLTPNYPPDTSNLGRIVYHEFLFSSAAISSFNTSFSFQIINDGTYDDACGSGFTFFLSHFFRAPVNSTDGYLGLSNTSSTTTAPQLFYFAVEFDTALSSFGYPLSAEPSSSHVGIDVNSLASINATNTDNTSSASFYPNLFLYNNSTFTAWISYDAHSFQILVWMVNASVQPLPDAPTPDAILVVQATYDLSTVLLPSTPIYVGFSGSNLADSTCSEGIVLYSWDFSFQFKPASIRPPFSPPAPRAPEHQPFDPPSPPRLSVPSRPPVPWPKPPRTPTPRVPH